MSKTPKLKEYKVTFNEYNTWHCYQLATNKNEAISKALEFFVSLDRPWWQAQVVKKAEIVRSDNDQD